MASGNAGKVSTLITAPSASESAGPPDWRAGLEPVLRAIASKPAYSGEEASARKEIAQMLNGLLDQDKVNAGAHGLLNAKLVEDAELIFRALTRYLPTDPAGDVGVAVIRTRQQQWDKAIEFWEIAARLAGERLQADWVAGHASSLTKLGRPSDALQLLESRGRDHLMRPAIVRCRLHCLVMLHKIREAREIHAQVMHRCADLETAQTLLEWTAMLFDDWARRQIYAALLGHIKKLELRAPPAAAHSAKALHLRVLLALRDYEGFLRAYGGIDDIRKLGIHADTLKAVAAALRRPRFPDYARQKVFGIGLSRTGTTSLQTALQTLGFLTLHWSNLLTGEIISDSDLPLFDAFVDTPSCMDFERNYYLYPNSVFIYTLRLPNEWEHSWKAYTSNHWLLADNRKIAEMMQRKDEFQYGKQFRDIHMALYFNHASYQDAYRAHDRRVRRFFSDKPRSRFLEFDVFASDGWEKLCDFLQRDVPNTPFPWENRGIDHEIGMKTEGV